MKKILYFGDSITDTERTKNKESSMGQGYATITASRLLYDHPGELVFENRGINGNRIVDLYARIKTDCWNRNPDVLSILIGINDVWHELGAHNGVEADRFRHMYDLIVKETKARFPDIKIVVMEPFVLPGSATMEAWEIFRPETEKRAAVAKEIAEENGLYFLPLQGAFDDACKIMPAEYWLVEGVHPTLAGHQLIANQWLKLFEEEIYPTLS